MYIPALPLLLLVVVAPWNSSALDATIIRHSVLGCWEDLTRFRPIVFRTCNDVIKTEITRGVDADVPFKFSKDPNQHPDIRLPVYWKAQDNSCGVGLDMAPGSEGWDRTTMRDIAAAAQVVAIQCIIKPPHVGGYIQVGWHDKLAIMITGKGMPPNELNATLLREVGSSRSHGIIKNILQTPIIMSHPSEDQKKAMYEGLSDDQKQKQTYTEWVKDAYANQYENWMPWIEDKYLAWFGTDNKASYATKDTLDKTKITGISQVDKLQDGVNNLVGDQVGKDGLLAPVGNMASKEGINRAERGGKDEQGSYGGPVGQYTDSAVNSAKGAGEGLVGGAQSAGGSVTEGAKGAGGYIGGMFGGNK
ncbi:MAG: hypothetical protein Q9186_003455 [Xanthomendoza sp. 1 TL-2023]